MLSFGVVVLHHNESDDLERCLGAMLVSQRRPDRLVLVDNASSAVHAARARAAIESHDGVFLDAGGNDGYAAGNNVGIRDLAAHGVDVVVLVNPDAALEPGCLDRLVAELTDDPGVAAANPLILSDAGRIWSNGGRFSRWQGRLLQPGFGRQRESASSGDTGFVTGCVLALRVRALEEVGLLDDRLFIYYEDVDLSERFLEAGWRLRLVADVVAVHRRGAFGDPDRNLSPFMLRHTMSSRGAYVRGRLRGAQRVAALAFTPIMAGRFAYLVLRSSSGAKREQLGALLRGTVEGLRRPALDRQVARLS